MLPQISPVQKCPHCGKYYLHYKQRSENGERPSFELGELSYSEWKEAYSQLKEERENSNQYKKVDERDLATICLSIIQAYNDYYERDCIAEFFLSMENYEKLEGVDRIYYEGIKERMEADDTKVFELFF